MPISPLHFVILFAAALAAGAINSVAGGGTLLTFPALLAVLGPGGAVLANGTSTVALVPGSLSAFWGYRKEMGSGGSRRDLWAMALPSLLGGAVGAYLAIHIGAAAIQSPGSLADFRGDVFVSGAGAGAEVDW